MSPQDNTTTINTEEQTSEQEPQYRKKYWYKTKDTLLPKDDLLKAMNKNYEDYLKYYHVNINDPVLSSAINEAFKTHKEAIQKDAIYTDVDGSIHYNANVYTPPEHVYKNNKTGEYITKSDYDALVDKKKEKNYTKFSVKSFINRFLESVTKAGYDYLYGDKKEKKEKKKFNPTEHGFGATGHDLSHYLAADIGTFIKAYDTYDEKNKKYSINGRLNWLKGELEKYTNSDNYKNLKDLDFEDTKYSLKSYQENISKLKNELNEENPNINKILLSLQGLGLNSELIKRYFSDTLPVSGAAGSGAGTGGDPNFPDSDSTAGSSTDDNEGGNEEKLTDDEKKVLQELMDNPSYKGKNENICYSSPDDKVTISNGKNRKGAVTKDRVTYLKGAFGKKDEEFKNCCSEYCGWDDYTAGNYYYLIKGDVANRKDLLWYILSSYFWYNAGNEGYEKGFYGIDRNHHIVKGSYNTKDGTVLILDTQNYRIYRSNILKALEGLKGANENTLKNIVKFVQEEESTLDKILEGLNPTSQKQGGALNKVAFLQAGETLGNTNYEEIINNKKEKSKNDNRPLGDELTEEYTVGFTPQDKARLVAAGMDLSSMIASIFGGVGTAIAVGADIGSLGTNLFADISDKNVSGWQTASNFGTRLGLSAMGLIPGLGEWGNWAKLARTLRPVIPKLLNFSKFIFAGSAISAAPEILKSLGNIQKVIDGEKSWRDLTSEDLRNTLNAIQMVLGGARAIGVKRANAAYNTKRQKAVINALNNETNDVYIRSKYNPKKLYKLGDLEKCGFVDAYKEENVQNQLNKINKQLSMLEDMPNPEIESINVNSGKWWNPFKTKIEAVSPFEIVTNIEKPTRLDWYIHPYRSSLIKNNNKRINKSEKYKIKLNEKKIKEKYNKEYNKEQKISIKEIDKAKKRFEEIKNSKDILSEKHSEEGKNILKRLGEFNSNSELLEKYMIENGVWKQGGKLPLFNIGGAFTGKKIGKYVGGAQIYFNNPDERINRILKKKIVKADDGTKIYGKDDTDYSTKEYKKGEYNVDEVVDLSVIYDNDNSGTKGTSIESNRDNKKNYENGQERLNLQRQIYWNENKGNTRRVNDFLAWANEYVKNNNNDININDLLNAYNKNVENIYTMFSTIGSKQKESRYLTDENIVGKGNQSHQAIYSGMNKNNQLGYEQKFENTFGSATSKRAIDRTEQEIKLNLSDLSSINNEKLKNVLNSYDFVKDLNGYIYATKKNTTTESTEESEEEADAIKPEYKEGDKEDDKEGDEKEHNNENNNKISGKLNLSEIIPDLAQLSKLVGTFIVNNKNANDKYPYTLYNPSERYRWIYGDQAAINRGYQTAGIYNHVANQPFTTDAMQQMAVRMENLSKGFDAIANGYTTNDKQFTTTRDANEEQNKANQQSRYNMSTKNMENITQSRLTDVVNKQAARNAKYQGVNNFIDYYANKFAQDNEERERVLKAYKNIMYRNDALNNPEKYGLKLSDNELALLRNVASGGKSVYDLTKEEEEMYYAANKKVTDAILLYRAIHEYGLNVQEVKAPENNDSYNANWGDENDTKGNTASEKQGGKLDNETKLEIQRMKNKIKNMEIMQKHYKNKLDHYEKSMDRAIKSADNYIKGMRK